MFGKGKMEPGEEQAPKKRWQEGCREAEPGPAHECRTYLRAMDRQAQNEKPDSRREQNPNHAFTFLRERSPATLKSLSNCVHRAGKRGSFSVDTEMMGIPLSLWFQAILQENRLRRFVSCIGFKSRMRYQPYSNSLTPTRSFAEA